MPLNSDSSAPASMRSSMLTRFRHVSLTLGAAVAVSTAVSVLLHAEFHRTLKAIVSLLVVAFALAVLGGLLFGRRVVGARSLALRISAVTAVAGLLIPVTNPIAFSLDMFRLKRFVTRALHPALESARQRSGAFPSRLSQAGLTAASAPYLLPQVFYRSATDSYWLSVMDPGHCGHVFTYSSKTRTWVEAQFECWY